jgi:AraC-like DNA-binding protein
LENNGSVPSHWHNEAEIVFPLQGRLQVAINGQTYPLDTNDFLFLAPGEIHEFEETSDSLIMIVQFPFTLINNLDDLKLSIPIIQSTKLITENKDPDIHSKILGYMEDMRELHEKGFEFKDACAYADLIHIFVLLAGKYTKITTLFPNTPESISREYIIKFTKILDYINENFASDISLEFLANRIGYSRFHFSRLFKRLTNMSFNEYINHIRIKKAESLLINANLSIAEVASMSGFECLSSFNRNFKLSKNCTPKEFRKLYDN